MRNQEPILRECKASLVEKYATAGKLGEEVKTLQAQLESKSGQVDCIKSIDERN